MSPSLLAVPALALVLGLGGVATAEAHSPLKHLTDEQRAEFAPVLESLREAREEHRAAKPGLSVENRTAINAALEAGDYAAFAEVTATAPFAGRVTEDKFNAVIEALELREAGDLEGAKQVLKDAGMHKPGILRSHRLTPPVVVE